MANQSGRQVWSCVCGNTPCNGLDCGVYLPGCAPRKKIERPAHLVSADRLLAWETRRARYGPHGHSGGYARTTCGDCIKIGECAYEFGAQSSDPVCTGFREPLRTQPKDTPHD